MGNTSVPRDQVGVWVAHLCNGIDARHAESGKIRERFVLLAVAAFLALMGVSRFLTGNAVGLVESFGQLAATFPFGGLPFFVGWIVRDRFRLRAIARENAHAYAELEKRGYEYFGGLTHVYRLPPRTDA